MLGRLDDGVCVRPSRFGDVRAQGVVGVRKGLDLAMRRKGAGCGTQGEQWADGGWGEVS